MKENNKRNHSKYSRTLGIITIIIGVILFIYGIIFVIQYHQSKLAMQDIIEQIVIYHENSL